MPDPLAKVLGQKINGTRVVPLMIKIVTIFTVFLLLSNFVTNYLNLMLNRGEQIRLLNEILVKDLKELYVFANNQHEIYTFNPDLESAVDNMVRVKHRYSPNADAVEAYDRSYRKYLQLYEALVGVF